MSVVVRDKMQPRYEKDRPDLADVIYKRLSNGSGI
jgi:hypothetical protein